MEDGEGNGNVNLFSEDEAGESDVEGGGVRRRGGLEDEAEEAELDELEEDIAMAERVSELDGDTSRIEANQVRTSASQPNAQNFSANFPRLGHLSTLIRNLIGLHTYRRSWSAH
jgi:hypothetical protein